MATQSGQSPTTPPNSPPPMLTGSAPQTPATPPPSTPSQEDWLDILLLVLVTATTVLIFNTFGTIITITLILLVGVWLFDAHWKRRIKINNTTIFADLSFTSLIYLVGKGIDFMRNINKNNDPEYGTKLFIHIFIFLLLWLLNLTICQNIENDKFKDLKMTHSNDKRLLASMIISFSMIASILTLQILNKI